MVAFHEVMGMGLRGMTGSGPPASDQPSSGLPARIKEMAREAGFDLCGLAAVRQFSELNVFPEWIADGRHGEMKYMEARDEAGELKRAALARVAPWARSVIVCAINYNTAQPYSTQTGDANRGWISRYAWSREDYHDAVLRRLRVVESKLHELLDFEATRNPRPIWQQATDAIRLALTWIPARWWSASMRNMPG